MLHLVMRAPRNTTEMNRDEIVQRFLNGETGYSIAKALGLHFSSVSKRLVRWGYSNQNGLAARAFFRTTASQLDLSYVAGLVDGEGCICICHCREQRSASPAARFSLTVTIGMTDGAIIRQLQRWFGGGVTILRTNKSRAHHKDGLRWSLAGVRAAVFLGMVLPYLHVKKRQAKIAIAFAKTLIYKGHKPPEGLYETRHSLWLAMRNDSAKSAKPVAVVA